MTPDKWFLSYRFYIMIIGLVATGLSVFFGIDITDDGQKAIADFCMQAAPVVMALFALISKLKENSKHRKEEENGKTKD